MESPLTGTSSSEAGARDRLRAYPRVQFWLAFFVPWTLSGALAIWDNSHIHSQGFFYFDPKYLIGGLLLTCIIPAIGLRKRMPDLTRGLWMGLFLCPFVLFGAIAAFSVIKDKLFPVR